MKLECSWCQKDLGTREPMSNLDTTHGMCPSCLRLRIYPFVRHVRESRSKEQARPDRRPLATR